MGTRRVPPAFQAPGREFTSIGAQGDDGAFAQAFQLTHHSATSSLSPRPFGVRNQPVPLDLQRVSAFHDFDRCVARVGKMGVHAVFAVEIVHGALPAGVGFHVVVVVPGPGIDTPDIDQVHLSAASRAHPVGDRLVQRAHQHVHDALVRQDIGISIGGGALLASGQAPGHASGPAMLSDEPRVFIYDNYPGGIGFSEPLFRMHIELLARTRDLIAGCECERGCPTCVGPVGNTGPLAKVVALRILDQIAAQSATQLGVA